MIIFEKWDFTKERTEVLMRKDARWNREAILKTATEVASKEGPQAITIRLISRKADVSETTIYRNFNSIMYLRREVVKQLFDDFYTQILEIVSDDPAEKLTAIAELYYAFYMRRPALIDLTSLDEVREIVIVKQGEIREKLVQYYQFYLDKGLFIEVSPDYFISMLLGPIMEAVLYDITGINEVAFDVKHHVYTFFRAFVNHDHSETRLYRDTWEKVYSQLTIHEILGCPPDSDTSTEYFGVMSGKEFLDRFIAEHQLLEGDYGTALSLMRKTSG